MKKFENCFFYFLLFVVFILGIWCRLDDLSFWKKNKTIFYYKDLPIYAAYDSFYFARLAYDYTHNIFKNNAIDNLRFFPDNLIAQKKDKKINKSKDFALRYSSQGNLISFLIGWINAVTGIPLEKIVLYLVPIFASLFVIPLALYLKEIGFPYAGLIGGIIGVTAPIYWARTNLMRLDTDCLNLFFPFFIAYCLFKYFKSEEKRGLIWIVISSIFLLLYYFWYSVSVLQLVLVGAFLFKLFWERKGRISKKDVIVIGILILPNIWYLYSAPLGLFSAIKTLVLKIKSPTAVSNLFKDFPNVMLSISELQKIPFKDCILMQIFNYPLGVTGLLGAFMFFVLTLRNSLFLLPFFLIGLLAFHSGVRFAMYLAPFIGIGIYYLVYFLIKTVIFQFNIISAKKERIIIHGLGILLFIVTIFVQKKVFLSSSFPKVEASIVKDMVYLRENTPSNSTIWSWWDYGYAFEYYSRRATFHDGGSQTTPKTYFIARSFATSSAKEAWYITSFISNYGLTGIAEFLQNGTSAKELLFQINQGNFKKPIKIPVYWVFTKDLIAKFAWIYYFGTYNFDTKKGKFPQIIIPKLCYKLSEKVLRCEDLKAQIDLNTGIIQIKQKVIPIKTFYYRDEDRFIQQRFFDQGFIFIWIKDNQNRNYLFFYSPDAGESLFVKMFLLRKYDKKYFDLVLDHFPDTVIYKVKELPEGVKNNWKITEGGGHGNFSKSK